MKTQIFTVPDRWLYSLMWEDNQGLDKSEVLSKDRFIQEGLKFNSRFECLGPKDHFSHGEEELGTRYDSVHGCDVVDVVYNLGE